QAVNRCLATVRAELAAAERERARYAHLPTDPFAPPPLPPGDPKPRDINIWAGRIQMDYPSSALRTEASGRVAFTTTVAANGRVSDCRVTESSGHADLDEAACRGMRLYARFDPAIDDDGNPIEGEWSSAVRYTLPE
ncbi:MAG: energy transducer TonB, partial [Gammaproteobacteria bacterium]|nr:energy transducer TonB [Gammaproteobacteria bacterium]